MNNRLFTRQTSATCAALALLVGAALPGAAQASTINGSYVPLVTAGAPPDTPAARVDPNLPTSPYSGVVSINIRYMQGAQQQSFICSGTLVSKRDVVTAGHCVDTTGNGNLIDIHAPNQDVRVVFNAQPNPGDPGRAIITADSVSMNPNYQGFGNCPYAPTSDFCLNDDIAVVHMSADAPASAKIYRAYVGAVTTGQVITMVGYGRSGDGINGYTTGPDFRIKRRGGNVMDLFDRDDEAAVPFASGPQEVWYADFDGGGQDTFCTLLAVCTQQLANDIEANIGGGDSGGPSFLFQNGEYFLLGNNTFGGTFAGQIPGAFGTYFGGMLVSAYRDYLVDATGGRIGVIPEPGSLALLGLAMAALAATRRRPAT